MFTLPDRESDVLNTSSFMQYFPREIESTMLTETAQRGTNLSTEENATAGEGILLQTPHSRMAGGTEYSWCKALGGGTGITVLALYFSESVDQCEFQEVVNLVQLKHPRLRSRLVWIQDRPAFSVSPYPYAKVQVLDSVKTSQILCGILSPNKSSPSSENCSSDGSSIEGDDDDSSVAGPPEESLKDWQYLVEHELNANLWSNHSNLQVPVDMFVVRLYRLPQGNSLAILRLQTAICDRASAATIMKQILHSFYKRKYGHPHPNMACESQRESIDHAEETVNSMAMEDAIPKGKANKPFWAHGIDLLGYSLGSKRHSHLPFEDPNAPRHSQIIRLSLSPEDTTQLLKACEMKGTTLSGALAAAGQKATAALKQLDNRLEHYAVISLLDCRRLLDPILSDLTVGFYHSAILNTHHINEQVSFWELARRCSHALDNSMKNRKHFTDMGDVNFLMCQAIQHPSLTPSSSLRTSLIVVFEDAMVDDMTELKRAIGLEDYLGCSSVHGVGPSLAVFDTIRNGALDCACVYPAPLHSRKQMHKLINNMKNILISAVEY